MAKLCLRYAAREESKLIRRNLDSNSSITYIGSVFSKKEVSTDPEKILSISNELLSRCQSTAETASCSTVHVPRKIHASVQYYEQATQTPHRYRQFV